MATVVELEMPADRLGASRTFERVPSVTFELGGVIGDGPPLVWLTGPDRSTVESALGDDPTVEVIACLTDVDDRWLYRLSFDRRMHLFQQLASANSGAVLEASGRDGTWIHRLLFHDHDALSDAFGLFTRYGFQPSVRQVASPDGADSEGSPLTETQYETIATAYERGYFDVPRKVTLEELAAELDISHQALSERLRRGHAALASAELERELAPTKVDP